MSNICIITNGYPTKDDPVYTFIQPLVWEFAKVGHKCTVIAPQSVTNAISRKKSIRPYKWEDISPNGDHITILQPKYFSLSNFNIGKNNISTIIRDRAIISCFKNERIKADCLYAHFWDCGIVASKIAECCDRIPVYVATGESKIRVLDYYPEELVKKKIENITGVICVSSKNKHESENCGLLRGDMKSIVLPNAYSPNEFYKMNKGEAKSILGFDVKEKIVAFVGEFSERKGVQRVIEAAKRVKNVKLVLIGTGDTISETDQIIFSGKVSHNNIVTYLNASDIFVLPTLAEGCCNAIIEAMACGLPIISSDRDFNIDILDETNSILIDPEDISDIAKAIELLVGDDNIMNKLAMGSLDKAKELEIEKRAHSILSFMRV